MADTGFSGDPYHENSTSKPLMSLQGGVEQPHTQAPMDSQAMTNPRSAAADNVGQTWNSTSLAPTAPGTPNNDKAEAH
jgi:hypothetical protein